MTIQGLQQQPGSDATEFVVRLDALADIGREHAGGKAVELAAMMRAGERVPDGFVILCGAPIHSAALRSRVGALVEQLGAPRVAVRSSARTEDGQHSSCAGLFETKLDVPPPGVLAAVAAVLDSAERGGLLAADMAVIVQPMIDAQQSGVCFSVDPVGSRSQMLIEAVDGLGEALVSGEVTPRRYRIDRDNFTVRGDPPKEPISAPVDPRHLRELAEIALRLEESTGGPVDLEWALCHGAVHLLQCRPVTAVQSTEPTVEATYHYI